MQSQRPETCVPKRVTLAAILLAAAPAAVTAAAEPAAARGSLVIELTGMQTDEGAAVYAVWSGPEQWLEDGAVREGMVPVKNGTSIITLSDLPYGEYAVSVYHDRNGNGRLDTGFFRIPKEPIGTSNDAKIRFGPPKYEDAAFELDRPQATITIPVRKIF